jgi:tetratricopeptide (TPR) repeat protein
MKAVTMRWLLLIAGMCGATSAVAVSGQAEELFQIKMHYQVQPDSAADEWVDVDYAEMRVRAGMSGTAFVGDAGITLVVATAGEYQLLADFMLTTLPPAATVISRQMLLERGQPIEVMGLKYEHRMAARVRITLQRITGELDCDFGTPQGARTVDEFVSDIPLHGAPSMLSDSLELFDDQIWYVDPSAHFELYFIPNTLGDFAWNGVRDYLEKEYQQFNNAFSLGRSQRVHYFIAPCHVPEIAWAPHRNWAVNPTTFKAYAIYNREHKDVSGIPTNMNHFYRYLGYAPMLLVEGASRSFEFDHYYAKKLLWRGRLPRLTEWWPTIKYKSYPDSALAIGAGSFVTFLIATQGQNKFFQLYGEANDLNADSAFLSVYGRDFRQMEDDWLQFLDTLRIQPNLVEYFVSRSKALGRNDESIELLELLSDIDTADVSQTQDELSLLYFLEGRYDDVIELIPQMSERYRTADRVRQLRHSALFFGGYLDSARAGFRGHLAESPDAQFVSAISLLWGWLELTDGNPRLADSLFGLADPGTRGTLLDQIEIDQHRAVMRRAEGKHAEADSLLRAALDRSLRIMQSRPGAADLYLRAGEAYVHLGRADTALVYLDVAEFLEYRPYYTARVHMAIGNAYDLLGMRDEALEYYRLALTKPSSYPSKVLARRYLKTPFKVDRVS